MAPVLKSVKQQRERSITGRSLVRGGHSSSSGSIRGASGGGGAAVVVVGRKSSMGRAAVAMGEYEAAATMSKTMAEEEEEEEEEDEKEEEEEEEENGQNDGEDNATVHINEEVEEEERDRDMLTEQEECREHENEEEEKEGEEEQDDENNNNRRQDILPTNEQEEQEEKEEEEEEENSEYEVENIVAYRETRRGVPQWRVRWKGFSAADDTWEKRANLEGSPAFWKKMDALQNKWRLEHKRRNSLRGSSSSSSATTTTSTITTTTTSGNKSLNKRLSGGGGVTKKRGCDRGEKCEDEEASGRRRRQGEEEADSEEGFEKLKEKKNTNNASNAHGSENITNCDGLSVPVLLSSSPRSTRSDAVSRRNSSSSSSRRNRRASRPGPVIEGHPATTSGGEKDEQKKKYSQREMASSLVCAEDGPPLVGVVPQPSSSETTGETIEQQNIIHGRRKNITGGGGEQLYRSTSKRTVNSSKRRRSSIVDGCSDDADGDAQNIMHIPNDSSKTHSASTSRSRGRSKKTIIITSSSSNKRKTNKQASNKQGSPRAHTDNGAATMATIGVASWGAATAVAAATTTAATAGGGSSSSDVDTGITTAGGLPCFSKDKEGAEKCFQRQKGGTRRTRRRKRRRRSESEAEDEDEGDESEDSSCFGFPVSSTSSSVPSTSEEDDDNNNNTDKEEHSHAETENKGRFLGRKNKKTTRSRRRTRQRRASEKLQIGLSEGEESSEEDEVGESENERRDSHDNERKEEEENEDEEEESDDSSDSTSTADDTPFPFNAEVYPIIYNCDTEPPTSHLPDEKLLGERLSIYRFRYHRVDVRQYMRLCGEGGRITIPGEDYGKVDEQGRENIETKDGTEEKLSHDDCSRSRKQSEEELKGSNSSTKPPARQKSSCSEERGAPVKEGEKSCKEPDSNEGLPQNSSSCARPSQTSSSSGSVPKNPQHRKFTTVFVQYMIDAKYVYAMPFERIRFYCPQLLLSYLLARTAFKGTRTGRQKRLIDLEREGGDEEEEEEEQQAEHNEEDEEVEQEELEEEEGEGDEDESNTAKYYCSVPSSPTEISAEVDSEEVEEGHQCNEEDSIALPAIPAEEEPVMSKKQANITSGRKCGNTHVPESDEAEGVSDDENERVNGRQAVSVDNTEQSDHHCCAVVAGSDAHVDTTNNVSCCVHEQLPHKIVQQCPQEIATSNTDTSETFDDCHSAQVQCGNQARRKTPTIGNIVAAVPGVATAASASAAPAAVTKKGENSALKVVAGEHRKASKEVSDKSLAVGEQQAIEETALQGVTGVIRHRWGRSPRNHCDLLHEAGRGAATPGAGGGAKYTGERFSHFSQVIQKGEMTVPTGTAAAKVIDTDEDTVSGLAGREVTTGGPYSRGTEPPARRKTAEDEVGRGPRMGGNTDSSQRKEGPLGGVHNEKRAADVSVEVLHAASSDVSVVLAGDGECEMEEEETGGKKLALDRREEKVCVFSRSNTTISEDRESDRIQFSSHITRNSKQNGGGNVHSPDVLEASLPVEMNSSHAQPNARLQPARFR